MRLAHFSDIHVTANPLAEPLHGLAGKRVMGGLNYFIGGRRGHFANVDSRIAALLADVDAQDVDHALCTGDVTQMSYRSEFERCAALFGARLDQPERWTVIPGNHDRYTGHAGSERRFERFFGAVAPPRYPFLKSIADNVSLVTLDVARPTGFFDSSGRVGDEQLRELEQILVEQTKRGAFVIVALHYGLCRQGGFPDRPTHGIRDLARLIAVFERPDVTVDMVLHGHMHQAYQVEIAGTSAVCVGSATDLHRRCGYNIYDLDLAARSFTVTRRVWDTQAAAYVAAAPDAA